MYRKFPSVLMLMSCSTNQIPILSWGSASLEALAARLPIRLRVNMPCGALATGGRGGRAGSYMRLLRSLISIYKIAEADWSSGGTYSSDLCALGPTGWTPSPVWWYM